MRLLVITLLCLNCIQALAQGKTIREQMLLLQRIHHVFFLYDAHTDLSISYSGPDVSTLTLKSALQSVFAENGINYSIHGHNIILKRNKKDATPKMYRLSGTITDSIGERLIAVYIFDHTRQTGTMTDERGQYSLFLPEGKHELNVSYLGKKLLQKTLDLRENTTLDLKVDDVLTIEEVIVKADADIPFSTTQTGKRTLTQQDIKKEFAFLSSPDLIKTLQMTSGVNNGVELSSGLFVHGGNTDENLFLLDGTPLYQTNHSLGLFSTFNADIIKHVDFYKSGFPARYSGRVSSVTDVRTKDGDLRQTHGILSLGLLDGRILLEGPIIKDKTSFIVSLRRSWVDLLLKPYYAVGNLREKEGDKLTFDYAFHDLNAKITHRFSDRGRLWLSVYSGHDNYNLKSESLWGASKTTTNNHLRWGNLNATLGGELSLSQPLAATLAIIGAFSYSSHDFDEDDSFIKEKIILRKSLDIQRNNTRLCDIGGKADFIWTPIDGHRIRFGASIMHHSFVPQTIKQDYGLALYNEEDKEETNLSTRINVSSIDATGYIEDEWDLNNHISTNVGASLSLFLANMKQYHLFDPRLTMKWNISSNCALKLSYTHMSQCIHRITSCFLDVPSDFWVPTTETISPTKSHQVAGGFYLQNGQNWQFSAEGFYKSTSHLLQYRHWMGLLPPAENWNKNVTEGRGKSYGFEADVIYKSSRLSGSLTYTLSFSLHNFPEIYDKWFKSQFDNKHKVNANIRYKLTGRISANAAFTLHSGNRICMPVASALMPQLPNEDGQMKPNYIYGTPNNFQLPTYHRLDLGFNFRHTTPRGHEAIWNVSLYNAYCHMNTMYVKIEQTEEGTISAKPKSFIPLIPSASFTLKF